MRPKCRCNLTFEAGISAVDIQAGEMRGVAEATPAGSHRTAMPTVRAFSAVLHGCISVDNLFRPVRFWLATITE